MHFNFEKNLEHQSQAVDSVLAVFEGVPQGAPTGADAAYKNPLFEINAGIRYAANITTTRQTNGIEERTRRDSNILDIEMETGTGKTYTYAKTIFELSKAYGIFKFIVVVPTLSIKAGTINFLKSDSSRAHFKELYGKTIQLHVVESLKSGKSKKPRIPAAVSSFVNAGAFEKNRIQVLLINAGMLNSETMQKAYDAGLHDKYAVPFEGLAATRPVVIVDEPHKFAQGNKTWEAIRKMGPQLILRYGATFPETAGGKYENLVYRLTAMDSFNRNLVKGVIGHIAVAEGFPNALVRLIDTDGTEARFELVEGGGRKTIAVARKEAMSKVHPQMDGLTVEALNRTTVVLSNGLELKRGDKINPYSYAQTLQESMLRRAIRQHFEIEKDFLTRPVRIKPLTLFFIDNIEEYRNADGALRRLVESAIEAEALRLLKTETDAYYRAYLEKTLANPAGAHAGYFSKDNTGKDEAIEKEVNEILHDKQALLNLDNPRRFIFSKWTLREGWDNPNVFQICKLRSSGSDISKLQEVGRGLRLPVNEYGNRVKEEPFFLNYFVDFTESDFIDRLVGEINEKSGAFSREVVPEKLSDEMVKKICEVYEMTEEALLETLDNHNVVTRSNAFKEGGFDYIRNTYPRIFEGVNSNKVRRAEVAKKKVQVRTEKYSELRALWEKLNEKVILEYQFDDEAAFRKLFVHFLKSQPGNFTTDAIRNRAARVEIKDRQAVVRESESATYGREAASLSTLRYSDFLKALAQALHVNLKTLHGAFVEAGLDMKPYLNEATVRQLTGDFRQFLMFNAVDRFSIGYQKVSNRIHPTAFTDSNGKVLAEVPASDVGVLYSDEEVSRKYLLDALYYDSDLERVNIQKDIEEVIVFTKIPKNAIRIPVAGAQSYSPDFAYVVKYPDGTQRLHFVVETKNYPGEEDLRKKELAKIRHAEQFFGGQVSIEFRTQFSNDDVANLINEALHTAPSQVQ